MIITFFCIFLGAILVIMLIGLMAYGFYATNNRAWQKDINLEVLERLDYYHSNFKASKILYLNDNTTCNSGEAYKKFIAIDTENRKICFVNYDNRDVLIVDFAEILNYEVYKNGSQLISGGGIGGFHMGVFGAETSSMCKELSLIIRFKNYENAHVIYNLISKTVFNLGLNKSSSNYQKCLHSLQEVVSFLEVIKNENQNNKTE